MHSFAATHLTFKELDRQLGVAKGSAFKAFKSIETDLVEDQDYWYYSRADNPAVIESLTIGGRLYAASVNAVILSPELVERITQMLKNT